uniref:type I restriction-modification enzyme R subunit C-terminal domain-containing protein n=1 Tax=Candidatus Nitrotoga sp. 1052 TaxID=2886964 RepID=UPI001EF52C42|nr:type I restriction-modification enzyme R subunit C-terminal domain-containing protein [Candidatus Nitrotoga sp. 1052]
MLGRQKKIALTKGSIDLLKQLSRGRSVPEPVEGYFGEYPPVDFVLSHYVSVGVEELDLAMLKPLLCLKYHDSIADAVADLGKPEEIGKVFSGFQKYLYQKTA